MEKDLRRQYLFEKILTDIQEVFDVACTTPEDRKEFLRDLLGAVGATQVSLTIEDGAKDKKPVLPKKAPMLWSERTTGREVNPVQFIQQYYGDWIGNGLTRPALRDFDLSLYNAYAAWIRRHPDDDLELPTRSDVVNEELNKFDDSSLEKSARLASISRMRQHRSNKK